MTAAQQGTGDATDTINEANPFSWASLAGTSGVPCATGCSLQIPRDPGKSAYVRLRFYNASNVLLETLPIGIQ